MSSKFFFKKVNTIFVAAHFAQFMVNMTCDKWLVKQHSLYNDFLTILPGEIRVLVGTWNYEMESFDLNTFQVKTINSNHRRARYHSILCEKRKYLFHVLGFTILVKEHYAETI